MRSRNLVSIRLLRSASAYARKYIEQFGFRRGQPAEQPDAGARHRTVTPLEMARAYAVFANGGFLVDPYYLDRIVSPDGEVTFEPSRGSRAGMRSRRGAEIEAQREGGGEHRSPRRATTRCAKRPTYLQQPGALAPSVISPQNDLPDDGHDERRDPPRHGAARAAIEAHRISPARPARPTTPRCLVLRLQSELVATAWVGFDQERSLGPGEDRRPHGAADVGILHGED